MHLKQIISRNLISFGSLLSLSLSAMPLLVAESSDVDVETIDTIKAMALQDNAQAQYNLGIMYARGQGVLQDDFKAV